MLSFITIEMDAAQSELTAEDYTFCLWVYLVNKKNKKSVNKLAKELNVYPTPANVYEAVKNALFYGIAI